MDKKNFRFDYHYSRDETPRATVCRGETLKEAEDSFRSIYVNGFDSRGELVIDNRTEVDEFEEGKIQREEIKEFMNRKDYLLTVYQNANKTFCAGDYTMGVPPRRYYAVCSLEEIPKYIENMKKCWWIHPDLKKGSKVKTKNIPFEEKQFGINERVTIEPLSEELEKSYLKASKDGFFESWRRIEEMEQRTA